MRNLLAPRSFPGAERIVSVATGSVQATMQLSAVIAEKIKHKHSQKESNFPLPSLTSALPPCSRPLEFIQPLATRAEAWQAIPGVSEWVMGIIKRGYSLQFARRPPRFSGVVSTSVQGENARVLRSEVMTLLEKGAIEMVPPALSESGFYSRYFLVPKKDGGLRPILDLRRLNHALMRRPFRMITLKQILSQIRTEDLFCSLDLKDAYFHIQIAPHHRRFLRFAFEGVAYQYTVLPFGLSLAPRTFTKCMDAALSPLRQMRIRILNYLDDWLILAQSEVELLSHRTLILSHLERLGLRVNFAKSALSPSQRISFLGTVLDSAHMRAVIAPERALAIQKLAATFKSDTARPLKVFQRMLGLMAAASPVLQLGLLRMRPLQRWLKPWVPHNAWRHGRLHIRVNSPDPLEEPTVDGEGRGNGVGPHQKSCHDRRLQHRLGGTVRRQTDLRPLVGDGERLPHQLLGNASSLSSLPVFPAGPNRTPCADSLRQHVRGVLYKSPGRCPLRGVDAPSAEDVEDLWQGRSRPFRLQRQHSLPNLLFEGQGRVGPRLAQPPPLCIPPDRPASTGRQAYQGTGSQGAIGGPLVEEPTLVVRADSATNSSPLDRAPETGSPLSGERNNMAPSTRAVGSLHLAAQWEPTGLPEQVLNTISEARAPSTRRLYALKWSVFSTWCLNRGENPSTSELAVVLSFLQELLDKGRSHSTLKVFVAAIAAFHAPIAGQSVGRDNSVVHFLKGARRLNPPRPLTVPTWDLPTVLRALKGPPFEPLQSTDLRSLSLKTALLLALASVKRVETCRRSLLALPAWNSGLTTPRSSWNQGMVTYLRYFQPRSELRSSRSPRFLRLRRTGSYLWYALSELWESTLSIPPLLGIRNSSLLALVTAPKDIRSRSRDSLSG